MNARTSSQKYEIFLLVALFTFELSLLIMGTAMYLKGEARSWVVFFSGKPGMAFGGAICALVISGIFIRHCFMADRRSSSRHFRMIVAMNVVSVVLILVTGEIVVRASVRSYHGYEVLGTLVLKPKNWQALKHHYRQSVKQEEAGTSFLMYDSNLGWTIRPNRRSSDGLAWSSAEGLRAPGEHVSFSSNAEEMDIALVGDSYTFGDEVRYEETYGYYLEQMLGARHRVLNFGVPGYGIDQMFLRYQQEVSVWKPKMVILGFISRDASRTLSVYPFLGNITWDCPFPRPYFILREGELVNIAGHLPTPKTIFSRKSISKVSLVQYHNGYQQGDWNKRFYHFSYLIRVFDAWASSVYDINSVVSEKGILLNAQLLKAFVQSVTQDNAIPLLVFFPTRVELKELHSTRPLGTQVLKRAGIDYVDPTPCLLEVDPTDRFLPGGHYSEKGNAAVAKCVYGAVQKSLIQHPSHSEWHAANDSFLHYQ